MLNFLLRYVNMLVTDKRWDGTSWRIIPSRAKVVLMDIDGIVVMLNGLTKLALESSGGLFPPCQGLRGTVVFVDTVAKS